MGRKYYITHEGQYDKVYKEKYDKVKSNYINVDGSSKLSLEEIEEEILFHKELADFQERKDSNLDNIAPYMTLVSSALGFIIGALELNNSSKIIGALIIVSFMACTTFFIKKRKHKFNENRIALHILNNLKDKTEKKEILKELLKEQDEKISNLNDKVNDVIKQFNKNKKTK